MGWEDVIGGLASLFSDSADSSVGDVLQGGTIDFGGMFLDTQTGNVVSGEDVGNILADEAAGSGATFFAGNGGEPSIPGQANEGGASAFIPATGEGGATSTNLPLQAGPNAGAGSNGAIQGIGSSAGFPKLSIPDLGEGSSPFGAMNLGGAGGGGGSVSGPSPARFAPQGDVGAGPTPAPFQPLSLPVGGAVAPQAGSQGGLSRLMADPFRETRETLSQDERRRGLSRLLEEGA